VRITRKSEGTPFERWGGQPFFDELVEQFYRGVADDPLLRPMYPDDLADAKRHLALFLGQFWGGPETYNEERGHPRLRMRHVPFVIGRAEAQAWLRHMEAAVDALGMAPDDRTELFDYLSTAARSLQNAD
jgi:hemoglobin